MFSVFATDCAVVVLMNGLLFIVIGRVFVPAVYLLLSPVRIVTPVMVNVLGSSSDCVLLDGRMLNCEVVPYHPRYSLPS